MSKLAPIILLLALTTSQLSAVWCPMDASPPADGLLQTAGMSGTAHDESGMENAHASHHGSENGHGAHENSDGCQILMSCGSMAMVHRTAWQAALAPPQQSLDARLPVEPDSLALDLELPPPRRI